MNKYIAALMLIMPLSACVYTPEKSYQSPSNLLFQSTSEKNNQKINVQRDDKLCAGDTAEKQNCPIDFYIDDFKSGTYFINNKATYNLQPNTYNLKVKNCTDKCSTFELNVKVDDQLQNRDFILSVDNEGKPFIIYNGQQVVSAEKPVSTQTTIDLAADTLFKFDGAQLNDLLPQGRQELINVADKIKQGFVSIEAIELTGHTDRLGSAQYNQQLGLNRANTVRDVLVQYGVPASVIHTSSQGKNQPITNGCFDVQNRTALQACLQADRRVTVNILGISK